MELYPSIDYSQIQVYQSIETIAFLHKNHPDHKKYMQHC